jgi:hypothetical protein
MQGSDLPRCAGLAPFHPDGGRQENSEAVASLTVEMIEEIPARP